MWPVTSALTRGLEAILEGFDAGSLHAVPTQVSTCGPCWTPAVTGAAS